MSERKVSLEKTRNIRPMRLSRIAIVLIIFLSGITKIAAQDVAIKTNGLYWLAGGTINGGVEVATSNRVTLQLSGSYNPWTYKNDKKMRFWLVEPEVKYWLCEKFEGHFFGLHGHGAQFFGGFRDKRYDGYMAGGGITYGYNWILSPHWNLEAEIGLGYERLWYKESDRIPCIKCYERKHKNYVGPTKAAISLVYIF